MNAATNTTKPRRSREILGPPQRFGEFVSLVISVLVIGFFAYHLAENTGFFTAEFGPQAAFFFFGPIVLAMAAPFTRAAVGLRNPARPLEVLSNVFTAIAAIWLLAVFPFDFTHLADALPSGSRFLLAWANNDIGRIPFILEAIFCPIAALVALVTFVTHVGHEPRNPSGWGATA